MDLDSIAVVRVTASHGSLESTARSDARLELHSNHLELRSTDGHRDSDDGDNESIKVPYALIHSVTRSAPFHSGAPSPLVVRTRTFSRYSIHLADPAALERAWDILRRKTAACDARPDPVDLVDGDVDKKGWTVYDPEREFARMGIGKRTAAWRFSHINADYSFCPSYPARIVVPTKISDTTLSYAVKYRSKARIPGLVYLHWSNLGSITRSSQPMVGITQTARSIQDEKLIEAIFASHSQHHSRVGGVAPSPASAVSALNDPLASSSSSSSSSSHHREREQMVYGATATNIIIDARPTTNAYANSVKGAGTENMSNYKNCRKEYLGIDNIHVMRNSLNGVYDVLAEADQTGHLDLVALRRTNWLVHLTHILEGVHTVVRTIHLSNSHVLVHCSDGWDRTSQLSALPQVCLDPYYRTAQGFAVLVEKDWVAYGHKFKDRVGLGVKDRIEYVSKTGGGGGTYQQQAAGGSTSASAESTAAHDGSAPTSNGSGGLSSAPSSGPHGFLASVQKQFGGASRSSAFKETCPVFHQFLECVYQLVEQFPDRFEFDERFLRRLVEESYTGEYGTFAFNSEKERVEARARDETRSVWSQVLEWDDEGQDDAGRRRPDGVRLKKEFVNPRFDPSLDDPASKRDGADQGVLWFDPQNVKWWSELMGRPDAEVNWKPPAPVGDGAEDDAAATVPTAEHHVVTSAEDDPVVHPILAALSLSSPSSSPSSSAINLNRSLSPPPASASRYSSDPLSPSRSASSSPSSASGNPHQLSETVASVQKLGWSAWKSVQKFGILDKATEAANRLYVAGSGAGATSEGDRGVGSAGDDPESRNTRGGQPEMDKASANGGGGSGSGSGMWSRFSTVSNPWAAPAEPSSHQRDASIAPSSTRTEPSYATYQPRSKPSSSPSQTSSPPLDHGSSRHHAPVPARQPSSALSINPWETISKEEVRFDSGLSERPAPSLRSSLVPNIVGDGSIERQSSSSSSGGDPLGVGF
ncbi:hypothetical protein JCM10212_001271 [Sporobolomyces blumeae]